MQTPQHISACICLCMHTYASEAWQSALPGRHWVQMTARPRSASGLPCAPASTLDAPTCAPTCAPIPYARRLRADAHVKARLPLPMARTTLAPALAQHALWPCLGSVSFAGEVDEAIDSMQLLSDATFIGRHPIVSATARSATARAGLQSHWVSECRVEPSHEQHAHPCQLFSHAGVHRGMVQLQCIEEVPQLVRATLLLHPYEGSNCMEGVQQSLVRHTIP